MYMRRIQQRKIKKTLYSKWTIIVLFLLSIFAIHALWGIYHKYTESQYNLDILTSQYIQIQQREGELQEEIQDLQSKDGIDKEIREKFSVVKEGEQVLVISGDNTVDVPKVEEKGFVRSVWDSFLGLFRSF